MDFLMILGLIVVGFILIRIVGKILKFVIGIAIVGLIIYVLSSQIDSAWQILNITV